MKVSILIVLVASCCTLVLGTRKGATNTNINDNLSVNSNSVSDKVVNQVINENTKLSDVIGPWGDIGRVEDSVAEPEADAADERGKKPNKVSAASNLNANSNRNINTNKDKVVDIVETTNINSQ